MSKGHIQRTGNANSIIDRRIGLLIGKYNGFSGIICSTGPNTRWIRLQKGSKKTQPHQNYKKSTLVILISGKHLVHFVRPRVNIVLKKQGDYIFIPPKALHSWECLKNNTTLLAITWKRSEFI